jgi:hypothetical protein
MFFHSVGCLLSLVTISFAVKKLFSLMQSHLFILSLRCWAIGVQFRKPFPRPICSSVFLTTSYSCFKMPGLILWFLIHFELILVQYERQGSSLNLPHIDIQYSQQHLLKGLFSSSCALSSFVKNQFTVTAWVYDLIFYSSPLVFFSVFVPMPCYFYCYGSVV